MKMYRTTNQTEQEIKHYAEKRWNSSSEENFVMRAASFGRGMKQLEVCAGREDWEVTRANRTVVKPHTWSKHQHVVEDVSVEEKKGMGEVMMIPLSLLAVIRKEVQETGQY